MNKSLSAWIFDVDGVITGIVERRITKPEIVAHIVGKLEKGEPVGVLSGRAFAWLVERVLGVFESYIKENPQIDPKILQNLFISGEFGGVFASYTLEQRTVVVKKDFALPHQLRTSLLSAAKEFAEYVFVDSEKQTMFTAEVKEGINQEVFLKYRDKIAERFRQVVGKNDTFEIHTDRLAVNVKNKRANKKYATDEFLNWLAQKSIQPQKYFVFGDSLSDLEMAEELHKHKLPLEFIFVGKEAELNNKKVSFPLTITKGHCDDGTLEYLNGVYE